MGKIKIQADKSQAGFTLVELAIVMIIIGLLIGGVLKGQELISNAQVNATVAQVKAIDAATTTFRDTYSAMPGDIRSPGTRLVNCTTTAECDEGGNGNGRVDGDITGAPADEMERFFIHLAAADLMSGINQDAADLDTWGGRYPGAQINGGFHVAYDNSGDLGVGRTRSGHYLVIASTAGEAPADDSLSALQAARIDRRLDDGSPTSGTVVASADSCEEGGDYDEGNPAAECDVFIRFQN